MLNLIVIFFCVLISASFSHAQITSTKMAEPKLTKSSQPYDGTENFLGENAIQYIGHDLYLKPRSKDLRKGGYENFVIDYKEVLSSKSNIYKCCDNYYNSKYEELAGKYFTVLDVLKDPKQDYNIYFLKLKFKDSENIVYYRYNSLLGEFGFPFISVSYFEKQKKDLVGKQFIKNWKDLDKVWNDISSGDTIKIESGSKWTCTEITTEEKYYSLILILKNNNNQTVSIYLDDYKNPYRPTIFLEEDAEKYKKIFGQEIWDKILLGKVTIGMPAEACELSWGRPAKINRTIFSGSKSEQWIYGKGSNYLYFENGILRSMQ